MPTFQEPSYKADYPARDTDEEYGTSFKEWYDENWDSIYWWK